MTNKSAKKQINCNIIAKAHYHLIWIFAISEMMYFCYLRCII